MQFEAMQINALKHKINLLFCKTNENFILFQTNFKQNFYPVFTQTTSDLLNFENKMHDFF